MIRRGNHFLDLDGDGMGWVLIDGPWFHYLNRFNGWHVRLSCLEELPCALVETALPAQVTYSYLDWERVRWHPGTLIPRSVWWKWGVWQYLQGRLQHGWRALPDGALPAYLNRLEFDLERDVYLRQMEDSLERAA